MVEEEEVTPVVIDLGKASRRRIKRLKRGRGRLTEEVAETLQQLESSVATPGENRVIVPIIVVYRRKRKGGRGFGLLR